MIGVRSAGIGAVAVLLLLGVTGAGEDQVTTATTVDEEQVVDLPDRVSVKNGTTVTAQIDAASRGERRVAALRFLPIVVVIVAVSWLLREVLGSMRAGDPFVQPNVRRLRQVAALLLLGVPLAGALMSLGDQALADSAGLTGRGFRLNLPAGSLLGGLGMLVLAEVFALGARMREDLAGTV